MYIKEAKPIRPTNNTHAQLKLTGVTSYAFGKKLKMKAVQKKKVKSATSFGQRVSVFFTLTPTRVCESNNVDGQSCFAQTPTTLRKRKVAESSVGYTTLMKPVSTGGVPMDIRRTYRDQVCPHHRCTCPSRCQYQHSKSKCGRTYSDSTALNATVLPILMSETMQVKMAVATIAFAGTWKRGST